MANSLSLVRAISHAPHPIDQRGRKCTGISRVLPAEFGWKDGRNLGERSLPAVQAYSVTGR